jgi:hypothetical protein
VTAVLLLYVIGLSGLFALGAFLDRPRKDKP